MAKSMGKKGTICGPNRYWEDLTHNFKFTFSFEYEAPSVETTL
jgi:hypothetical protein